MMVDIGDLRVMEILSKASNTIAEGEVLQLMNCNDPDTTQERYMEVIRFKTAKLFEAATQVGAILSEQSVELEQHMAAYGMHLGTAFQLIDDVLDYRADSDTMGKNVGDDLAEGKPTLPIIFALKHADPEQAQMLKQVIEHGDRDQLEQVVEVIQSTKAIDYTQQVALQEVELAKQHLECLPDSDYKMALLSLADFSVSRLF
jgi:octaprenyl-diphosphate synthase